MTVRAQSRTGRCGVPATPPPRATRHECAVANTLSWAQDAADREAFDDALHWLLVVEIVDGALPAGWAATQASWRLLAA